MAYEHEEERVEIKVGDGEWQKAIIRKDLSPRKDAHVKVEDDGDKAEPVTVTTDNTATAPATDEATTPPATPETPVVEPTAPVAPETPEVPEAPTAPEVPAEATPTVPETAPEATPETPVAPVEGFDGQSELEAALGTPVDPEENTQPEDVPAPEAPATETEAVQPANTAEAPATDSTDATTEAVS